MQFYHQNIISKVNMYSSEAVLSANLLQSVIFTQYSFKGFQKIQATHGDASDCSLLFRVGLA